MVPKYAEAFYVPNIPEGTGHAQTQGTPARQQVGGMPSLARERRHLCSLEGGALERTRHVVFSCDDSATKILVCV